MNFMTGIKDRVRGRTAAPELEFKAILYGIQDVIDSGYTADAEYDPIEHKALIDTYLGATENLKDMSFLKKGKQKKLCAQLKADIEEQNGVFRTVYDSILSIEPVSINKESSTTYAEKLQNVYSAVKDIVPNISAERLKEKALFNPRSTYVAGMIALIGTRTAGAMLTQDPSSLDPSDLNSSIENLSYVLNEASTSGSVPDAAIYTGDLTADLNLADNWERIITHPDFTQTQDFEEALKRLYSIDPSEISNLPEELQARIKEIQDIYAQNLPVDASVTEPLGEGELIEWGNDGKDVYTAENYLDLVEKTGPANTLVNEYSISNDGRINVAVESGYEVKVHAYNDDWTKGPTGAIIELVPADEADSIADSDSALTKENITLEDAIKGSFGEENMPKEFHIVEDKPFDSNKPPVSFATANPDEGNVMATKVGRNDNSYICVGFEPPRYDIDGHLTNLPDSLRSPWGQLEELLDKYSNLFPSGGGTSDSGGLPGDGGDDDFDDGVI